MVCQSDCGIAWLLNDYIHSDHVKRRKQLFSSLYSESMSIASNRERGEAKRGKDKCVNERDESQLIIIILFVCLINRFLLKEGAAHLFPYIIKVKQ